MNHWYDIIDWIGGFPYEVARPEPIIDFYGQRGYSLFYLKTTTSLGNNEYIFQKTK